MKRVLVFVNEIIELKRIWNFVFIYDIGVVFVILFIYYFVGYIGVVFFFVFSIGNRRIKVLVRVVIFYRVDEMGVSRKEGREDNIEIRRLMNKVSFKFEYNLRKG